MTKGTLKPKLHIGVNSQNCIIRVFDKGKGNSNERFPRLTEGLRKRSKDWKEILCSGEEIAWAQKTFIWKGTRGSTGKATEQLNRACSLARVWGFTGSLEEDQGHIWNWFEQEWEIQLAYQNLWWTEGPPLWEFWRGLMAAAGLIWNSWFSPFSHQEEGWSAVWSKGIPEVEKFHSEAVFSIPHFYECFTWESM